MVLTTDRGIGLAWGQMFEDPVVGAAMLDRLLHRSTVLQINRESYRMRAHRARLDTVRMSLRPPPAPDPTRAEEAPSPQTEQPYDLSDGPGRPGAGRSDS